MCINGTLDAMYCVSTPVPWTCTRCTLASLEPVRGCLTQHWHGLRQDLPGSETVQRANEDDTSHAIWAPAFGFGGRMLPCQARQRRCREYSEHELVMQPWVNGSSSPSVRHEKCPEQMEAERNLFRSAVLLC
ncbi:hypothetical protein AV530_008492 [Patagioenas fasciata monilis]|uniref:Uncharacterized protein n=1 Tax=Patagioenas fasciata monilis TaxID=372326 RepID=A0A1V4L1K8_PATFA|nr:hypothetical protein AV530_008492 [Patagioenas fasciata monilis]